MAAKKDDFYTVLTSAIDDLIVHGFDKMERIEQWTRALRAAAEKSLVPPATLEQMLRDGLADIYKKLVDKGGLPRYHQGIDRFTLERIKPSLRGELDRRILASANLIKLNRQSSIEKTLQRFQGWSTSIPPGGVSESTKAETRTNIRKSLAQLPWEERRVLIDQGHKLIGAINEVVAKDGGAIAGIWRSHWRQPGYNYREDHKERDQKIYLVRDSWAHAAGLVKKGGTPYYDEITAVGQEPFCRCYMVWLYNLRDLPAAMLTAKGKASLEAARGQARGDSMDAPAGTAAMDAKEDKPARGVWHLSWMRRGAFPGSIRTGTWCNRMQSGNAGGINCVENPDRVTCKFCKQKIAAFGLPKPFVEKDTARTDDAGASEQLDPKVGVSGHRMRLERLRGVL